MSLGPELIQAQAREISQFFAGSKVRKTEGADNWAALMFSADRSLFFSWDPDYYGLSTVEPGEIREMAELARKGPPILYALKSHIVGSELIEARALHRDRILLLEFRKTIGAGFYQEKSLLFEASGRYSNLMLLDKDSRIIEIAKHIHADTNRYRSLLPGLPYTPPPPLRGVQAEDFQADSPEAGLALEKIVGIGKPLLSALQKICGEKPEQSAEILRGLSFFGEDPGKGGQKYFYFLNGYLTLYPQTLPGVEEVHAASALEAARAVVVSPLIERVAMRERKKLRTILQGRLKANARKLEAAESGFSAEGEAGKNLLYGKLILANTWAIPARAKEATLEEWTDNGKTEHTVTLDPNRNASANAERYFARYRRQRASMAYAKKTLPALCAKRDELIEQLVLLEHQSDPATLALMALEVGTVKEAHPKGGRSSKSKALPPHAKYEIRDAVLYIGLSAKGNRYVTLRLARPNDIWLHAQKLPGAHVILRSHDKRGRDDIEAEILELAAAGAAYYSKGKKSAHVRVDYTEKRHVRAIPEQGLAHMSYREFGTITADVSLWEEFLEGHGAALRAGQLEMTSDDYRADA